MKRKFLPLLLTVVLVVAAAIVPMLTLTASAAETATITFDANKTQRTSYSTTKQVWTSGDVTFINDKGSGNNVGDYGNPVRIYAGSSITITAPGNITKIVVAVNASKYVSPLTNSMDSTIATASGTTVTITPSSNSPEFQIGSVSAQTRFNSITVTYEVAGDASCEHPNTTSTTVDATCTEAGSTIVTCDKCDYILSETDIPKLGHDYSVFVETVAPTKTEAGYDLYKCSRCDSTDKQNLVDAIGYVVNFDVLGEITTVQTANATMPVAVELGEGYTQNYVFAGWTKAVISEVTSDRPELYQPGDEVAITEDTTFYAVYSYAFGEVGNPDNYILHTGELVPGDYLIVYGGGAMKAGVSSNRLTYADVTVSNDTITRPDQAIVWTIEFDGNYVTIYNAATGMYAASTGTKNQAKLLSSITDNARWTVSGDATYEFVNLANKNANINCNLRRNDNYGFACYATGTGGALSLYRSDVGTGTAYYTTNPIVEDAECTHENKVTTTQDATCTEDGYTVINCDDCGAELERTPIPATDHSYDDGVVTTDPTCTEDGEKTYTCQNGDCGHTYTEKVDATGHNYVDGTCENCGAVDPASVDYSGRYYIAAIRSEGNYFWMTSDLGTAKTKRYQAVDSGLTKLPSSMTGVSGYVFVLEKNDDDTYSIYAEGVEGDNYLGWTSDNSGILVAESDALKFTVDVKEDGTYNIHFAASDGERYLSLNSASSSNYFAFYKGTQKQDLSLIPAKGFTGASVTIGSDLSMNYFVTLPAGVTIDGYSVKFTFNGVESAVDTYTEVNGEYVFTLAGIGPQNYQDKIVAELVYNEVTVCTKDNYTVEDSLNGYAATESTKELANATLAYCAAAKAYVSDEITSTKQVEGTVAEPETGKSITNNVKVTAVGVNFDYVNKIYVKLNADATVTFNFNEVDVAAEVENLGNGVYIAYSDALTALQFGDTVTIKVDGTTTTVTYSVNAYAYTIYTKYATAENLTEKQLEMYNLAVTLYNYGVAAEAYKTAQSAN